MSALACLSLAASAVINDEADEEKKVPTSFLSPPPKKKAKGHHHTILSSETRKHIVHLKLNENFTYKRIADGLPLDSQGKKVSLFTVATVVRTFKKENRTDVKKKRGSH